MVPSRVPSASADPVVAEVIAVTDVPAITVTDVPAIAVTDVQVIAVPATSVVAAHKVGLIEVGSERAH